MVQVWSAPDWHLPNGHTFLSGPASLVLGFLLGVLLLLRPGRLTLAPERLQYESLLRLRCRSWRWQNVSPFGTARVGAGKARRNVIEFNGPEWEGLPARWELPVAEVLEVVEQWRNQRVATILAAGLTATAIATVMQLRERGSRPAPCAPPSWRTGPERCRCTRPFPALSTTR